jgi:hypothetical protein
MQISELWSLGYLPLRFYALCRKLTKKKWDNLTCCNARIYFLVPHKRGYSIITFFGFGPKKTHGQPHNWPCFFFLHLRSIFFTASYIPALLGNPLAAASLRFELLWPRRRAPSYAAAMDPDRSSAGRTECLGNTATGCFQPSSLPPPLGSVELRLSHAGADLEPKQLGSTY